MKIRLVGAELFHADGRTDMKLIVAYRNFANAPKNMVTEHKLKIKMEYGKIHIELRMTECFKNTFFFLWRCDPTRVMASSFLRFLDHTQRRITSR